MEVLLFSCLLSVLAWLAPSQQNPASNCQWERAGWGSESKGGMSDYILVYLLWDVFASWTAHIQKLVFLAIPLLSDYPPALSSGSALGGCVLMCLLALRVRECVHVHMCVSFSECWCERAEHYLQQLSESWRSPNNPCFRVPWCSVKTVTLPDCSPPMFDRDNRVFLRR